MDRRTLLALGGTTVAGATLIPLLSRAQARPQRNLVIVLANGGWDPLVVLDPKSGPYGSASAAPGQQRSVGSFSLWDDASRPNVRSFFETYGDQSCLINGIQVSSFIHPDCMRRMLTGGPSDHRPDIGAIIAYEFGRTLPIPYLVLGANAIAGPYGELAGRVGLTRQLAALIRPADDAYLLPANGGVAPRFEPTLAEQSALASYQQASIARVQATRGMTGANQRAITAFERSFSPQTLALLEQTWSTHRNPNELSESLGPQIDVTVNALQRGISKSVLLQTDGWDTHQNTTLQGPLNNTLFGALKTLGDRLQQAGLLSNTLVVVVSEMGRTPRLNSAMGKDHWPVTSALCFGSGLRGSRTLGSSSATLEANTISLQTGLPTAGAMGGVQLQSGNVLAAFLEIGGVDSARYLPGVERLSALSG